MHLVNAGNSSFPEAWEGYQVRWFAGQFSWLLHQAWRCGPATAGIIKSQSLSQHEHFAKAD